MALDPLEGPQKQLLSDALLSAFNEKGLHRVLHWNMKPSRNNSFPSDGTFPDKVYELIEAGEREGWTADLIVAACAANPGHPGLQQLAADWGIRPSNVPELSRSSRSTQIDTQPQAQGGENAMGTPGPRAWVAEPAADSESGTGIRSERWVARAQQLATLLAHSQDLYNRISKTTEQLIRYRGVLQGKTPGRHGTWEVIALGLHEVSWSLIDMREEAARVLEDSLADEFAQRIAAMSTAVADVSSLGPDEVLAVTKRVNIMRSAAVGIRGNLKDQLEATLREITRAAVGDLGSQTNLLLSIWDQAFKQYELWDKCWETIVATHSRASDDFWLLVYERAEEAAQASDAVIIAIEAWIHLSAFGNNLQGPVGSLREAILRVDDAHATHAPEILSVVAGAKDSARGLEVAVVSVVLGWTNRLINAETESSDALRGVS